ncbi:C2H2 and C2HC zinc finger [Glarea lozoyensis ATCC 20868]|uniref:C2H2 and C2HC zinc finger n=2 Tax=Glarea lozoyensis TaxID=101852 RepID=S3DGA7_GLAL2|nr:C2H2 and C2HC zinc finger [Glarea lozoyensis ATCC 20868]EPE36164.1 C2H2 and C2HC zinc finger [Glarea lozoyensis ATCC 20868]
MVSLATHTYNMLNQMSENEEHDFPLYPDPQAMFSPPAFPFSAQNFNVDNGSPYTYTNTQDGFPVTSNYQSTAMYSTEAPPYLESPDLRGAPSSYSTASGPSASPSAVGSPHSIHNGVVPSHEWATQGLGLNPSIVGYDNYTHGNEYTFAPSGMEEFDLSFNPAKPNGFVGECQNISRTVSYQRGSVSSNSAPLSLSTIASSPATPSVVESGMPKQEVSTNAGFVDECFKSPVSAFSRSPSSSRRPSQIFNPSHFASSSAGRGPAALCSPVSSSSRSFSPKPIYQSHFFSQSSGNFVPPLESSYPSILHPQYATRPTSVIQSSDTCKPPTYPASPALSQMSRSPQPHRAHTQSPYMNAHYGYPYPPPRQRSPGSRQSCSSQDGNYSGEESKEKGRCTYPECGKVFKDLKAHMLTHQNERPEKCPIQTCDYHVKGFARKYDKNRHTLTHYKGTMVCGFCPGSGSAAEKSFNRADVFKRHLTSVHAVEQTPPNSRKKTSGGLNSGKKLSGYAPDATGKCSTCSATFNNAQDFYEHLDDCVLRIVQQEEPSEAINAARLAEVEQDHDVHTTLTSHQLPTTTMYSAGEEDTEEDYDDENDDDFTLRSKSRKSRGNRNPANGVQKSRGMTHSKGGHTLNTKGRKKRKDYPSSWGCPTSQMKLKKRVLCVFDGPRRLWKDDMMLDTDYEVRLKLRDEKAYVTDLDVQTMNRAEAFHDATEEEKGPWIADDLTGLDLEKLMEVKHES